MDDKPQKERRSRRICTKIGWLGFFLCSVLGSITVSPFLKDVYDYFYPHGSAISQALVTSIGFGVAMGCVYYLIYHIESYFLGRRESKP